MKQGMIRNSQVFRQPKARVRGMTVASTSWQDIYKAFEARARLEEISKLYLSASPKKRRVIRAMLGDGI